MISLRLKLLLGFGGLLAVLVAVSILSVAVLTAYSHSLERVFHENYNSAVYCNSMKESLDAMIARAQRLIWEEDAAGQIDAAAQEAGFANNLRLQIGNVSLPGEAERTRQLSNLWDDFLQKYRAFDSPGGYSSSAYREELLPRYQELKLLAQQIADMNINNMVTVDGQGKRTVKGVRRALLILAVTGAVLASIVVWTASAAILHPLRALTRSARQMEAGDLDQRLDVKSHDEIGLLAEAFNAMAARIREFRRLDHDRLLRTQDTTQLAIDSLPDAVFVIGPDHRVEISNRTAATHFQIEPGVTVEGLGLKWLSPLYESILHHHKPIEPQGYAAAIQLFDAGEERFLLPRAVPMLNGKKELIGVTVILVDVTRLRRADEAKSSVISTVSHELRTPLTGMRMSLSLLSNEKIDAVPDKRRRLVAAAREDSDRLHRIIENLLNMSRIESGRAQYQFRTMKLNQIVKFSLDPLRPAFAEKKITLSVAIDLESPEVSADPLSIGLAMTNLLSNALKFTPAGGSVMVAGGAEGALVDLRVIDNGPGIPLVYRERIFEKFFRIPGDGGPTGAGLGLTIAREIIEAHAGSLSFECPPTGGSIFHIRLPALIPAEPLGAGKT